MAEIVTDEDFAKACNWLIDNGQLPVTGERSVIASERKVYDRTAPGIENRIDITPSQAVLEAALDAALTAAVQQQEIDEANTALIQGREYLKRQFVSATPHTLMQLVNNIKPVVDGNTFLLRAIENKIDVMSVAFGWTAADVKTPDTAPNDNALNRARYIEAVMQIIALLG
jgi:hypothetical protein